MSELVEDPRIRGIALGIVMLGLGCSALIYVSALEVQLRAEIASTLLNVFAAALACSAVAGVCTGAWRVARPSEQAFRIFRLAVLCAGVSLFALLALGPPATRLNLSSNMVVQVGADFVFIGGAIAPELPLRLEETVHPGLRVQRVVLSSSGGSVEGAMAAVDWFQSRGVRQAIIEGDCTSACALLALMMPERYLTPGAALGFHDLWGRKADSDELQRDRAKVLSQLDANGIDVGFIAPLMVGRDLRYPDRAQLLSRRIVTGCWSQTARAPEPCADAIVSRTD